MPAAVPVVDYRYKASGKPGIPPLWGITPDGRMDLNLHAGQARAWLSPKRFIAVIAGSQSGKTSFGPLWLWNEMRKQGPGDYLMVTPTIPLSKMKALPEFLRFFDDALGLGKWHAADRFYEIDADGGARLYGDAEPSRVIFGSAVNPESLESATAKAAWLDECGQQNFRLESWEAIQRRLLLHEGRALMTTTPYSLGWLKVAIYDEWKGGDPNIEVLQFASTANPTITAEALAHAKRTMPKWRYEMMYEGKFTKPDDLIYGTYNDDPRAQGGMRMDPVTIQPHWPVWVGVDFGGANTVTLWLAHNTDDDEVYAFHETHEGGLSTAAHCQHALDYASEAGDLRGHRLRVLGYIGGARNEGQSRLDWTAQGVPVEEPPVFQVNEGIDRVHALLASGRFFVFNTCRRLRSEFGSYQRKMTDQGEVLEDILHKNRYHALDALRYGSQKIVLYGLNIAPGVMVNHRVKQGADPAPKKLSWVPTSTGILVPAEHGAGRKRVAWA